MDATDPFAFDAPHFSISAAGNSDYKLNGKSVPYKKYNEQLESFNILVKAKNFLVFQVRSPSPFPSRLSLARS